jgi:hypothetical protein
MRLLRITETHDYDLIGTLLPTTEKSMLTDQALSFAPAPALISITPSQLPAR